jgi:hypothetical protein
VPSRSFLAQVSEDIVGDTDGPLGKRRDGSFVDGPSVSGIIQGLLGHPGGFGHGGGLVSLGGSTSTAASTASLPLQLPIMGIGSKSFPTLTPRFAPKPGHNGAGPAVAGGDSGSEAPPNPTTIVTLCAWYAVASEQIASEGATLAASLTEVAELCAESYKSFEGLCHAFMIGGYIVLGNLRL